MYFILIISLPGRARKTIHSFCAETLLQKTYTNDLSIQGRRRAFESWGGGDSGASQDFFRIFFFLSGNTYFLFFSNPKPNNE